MTDDDIYKYKYLKYKSKYFNLVGGSSNDVFIVPSPTSVNDEHDTDSDLASVNTTDTSSSGSIKERAARLGDIERQTLKDKAKSATAERMKKVKAETGVSEEMRKKREGVTTRLRELLSANSDSSSSSVPITRSENRVDTGNLSRLLNSQNQSQTDYTTYERMLKNRVPEQAIRQRMTMDGFSEQQINDFFTNTSQNNETQVSQTTSENDESKVKKLFKRFIEFKGDPEIKEAIIKCLRQVLIN